MTRKEAAEILGVSQHANLDEVKRAYRKMAMKYHPDQNPDDNAKALFIAIHDAYSYLTDLANGKISESSQQASTWARRSHENHPNWSRDFNAYTSRSYTTQEEFEKRYEEARRRAEQELEKRSQLIYKAALREYKHGWKKVFVKYFAPFAALLGVLLCLDFFLEERSEIRTDTYVTEEASFDGHYFYYHYGKRSMQITSHLYERLYGQKCLATIHRKPLLGDVTSISIECDTIHTTIQPFIRIHNFFPLIHLLFFLPLVSLFIEKARFWFVFFVVYGNLYIIPSLFALIVYRTLFL